ncbi:2-phosphosulfolactate phosphatase [Paenibacillus sp. J2TS4]|uniref:2-phosphosulfolactate phosphatase n=1 Tax=Paenibacillus sp. J2TS4 TaxID=2807194 RepID=UPI001B13A60D|nr:2-phosphosulfolactate phosphatase [Paenibacillus sp. J2TS4]GIP32258.1 putative 2-phosphosulfolactate phosphatase [Paenibacillus sp. J2TS4]
MQIDVIPTLNDTTEEALAGKTVIVIDVLRATSNIVTGLFHGSGPIVPVATIQQAYQLKEPGDLLGGERNCERIAGFDLGNSPYEFKSSEVSGKRIVLTTTNGTLAISKTKQAEEVLIGSFLNASVCAAAAASSGRDIAVLCSGTKSRFSLEDGLCAGLIARQIKRSLGDQGRSYEGNINDFGLAMEHSYEQASGDLTRIVLSCSNGIRLRSLGQEDDVRFCCQVDALPVLPILTKEETISLSAAVNP